MVDERHSADDRYILALHNAQAGWRRITAQAVLWGIPIPAFSTALAFFDGYRSEILPANLLQAQVSFSNSVTDDTLTIDSVITSVLTHSEFFLARKMKGSDLAKTSVCTLVSAQNLGNLTRSQTSTGRVAAVMSLLRPTTHECTYY